MQQTSDTYKRIISGEHQFETSVTIGDSGRLVDKYGDLILFGGDSILVDTGGAESGFREDKLFSVDSNSEFFKISIHAPRGGSDCKDAQFSFYIFGKRV